MAIEQVVEEGNQRGALASNGHVGGAEVGDVLIDQLGQLAIEAKLQGLLVLDVEPGKAEPVIAIWASGLYQVDVQPDRGKIAQTHGRNQQDCDCNGDLRQ